MAITNLKTPGVYIDEISTLGNAIVPVATAVPAFVGYTFKGPVSTYSPVPVRIESMKDFETVFGGGFPESFVATVADTTTPSVTRDITITTSPSSPSFLLYYSMQMYFANGGGPCWVVSTGYYGVTTPTITDTHFTAALDEIAKIDEPTLLLFPDASKLAIANYKVVATAALTQCNTLQDRFTILDVPGGTVADAATFRNSGVGINDLKYGAAYMPYLNTVVNYTVNEAGTNSLVYTVNAVATNPTKISDLVDTTTTADNNPGLYRQIISKINDNFRVTLPPSGAIAGIYCAVDRERGVWKAPANVSVNNVIGPKTIITDAQQGDLNVDATSGKSINVIRSFTGKGTLVWGARTLAGNDNEWRYIPVRRLFNMAEESVKKATEAYVFEANDKNTWLNLKSMIGSFLSGLWAQGALVGNSSDKAYFVKVGLGETMTAQDVLEGRLIIRIGLAAVRPAEFIILEFQHTLPTA